jgi:signal peptidase I
VRFRASGWSMHPTIRDGEIITVAPLGQSPIRAGDVVLYRRGRATIAHRVIHVRPAASGSVEFVLRGDSADFCDRPIALDHVLGCVHAIERAGRTRPLGLLSRTWCRALGRMRRSARALLTISRSSLRNSRVRVT